MIRQFISFSLGEQRFGLDIVPIREVIPRLNIMPVSRSREHMHGLVNIRGQVILVIDAALIIGMEKRVLSKDSHIIIFKTAEELRRVKIPGMHFNPECYGDKAIGILVDSIGEVITLDDAEIEPVPSHIEESRKKFFLGVARQERFMAILNADEIIIY